MIDEIMLARVQLVRLPIQYGLSLLMAVLGILPIRSYSATIQWTNSAGGFWGISNNWSPNVVPSSADTAVITNDGNYAVTLNINPTISALTLGGQSGTQTLRSIAAVLTVSSNATVGTAGRLTLEMSGAALQLNGGMTVHGSMVWSNGILGGTSVLTIASNGTLKISGSGSKQLFGNIQNHGQILVDGTGTISALGSLHNLAAGLLEVQSQAGFSGSSGSRLVNDGILRKSVDTGIPSIFSAPQFTNNGVIEAQSGGITLRTVTLGQNSSYLGSGIIRVESGTMNGAFTTENLVLAGNVTGTGVLHGTLTWSNGLLGALTITPPAILTLSSSTSRTLGGSLTNNGTIVWAGGGMNVNAGVTLHNKATGFVEVEHSGNASLGGLGTPTKFIVNEGTIRKSIGTGTSTIGIAIHKGIMDAQTGAISIGSSSPGSSAVVIGAGSSFTGAGTNHISGAIQLEGPFIASNLVGGNVQLQGAGTLQGTAVFREHLNLMAGAALTVSPGSSLAFRELSGAILANFGFLTNAGTISLDGSAIMAGNSVLHNLSSGVIDLKRNGSLGGSGTPALINEGTIQKSAGTGTNTLLAGLNFLNRGTVRAQIGTLLFNTTLQNPGGTLALAGGNIQCATPLTLPAGRITGSGTLQAPSITSAGTVDPGTTNSTLVLSGSYTQLLAGSIYFDLGGLLPGVNHSQVLITSNAHLRGLIGLRFSAAYSPEAGTSHSVLGATSLTGNFQFLDGLLLLGQGKRIFPTYSPTNLTLTTIAAADPAGPNLSLAADTENAIVFWPAEFPSYTLHTLTNLNSVSWTAIPGTTNRHFVPLTDPQRLFKLVQNL